MPPQIQQTRTMWLCPSKKKEKITTWRLDEDKDNSNKDNNKDKDNNNNGYFAKPKCNKNDRQTKAQETK